MSVTIIKPKDKADWLQHRTKGIGSSEVASIIGINQYQSPYQLWRQKKGIDPPSQVNFFMKAGNYLEDAVAQFWQDETQREVIKASADNWIFVNNEKPYLRASPDRTFWLKDHPKSNSNKGILECKTTQKTIDPDDLPKTWFVQLQWLLGVGEMEHGSLAWLCSGRSFDYKDIEFNPDFFKWLVEEVDRFWYENILGNQEPEVTTVADVVSKFSQHTPGKSYEVTTDMAKLYDQLKDLKAQSKILDSEIETIESLLKIEFKDAEALTYCGNTIATWKATKEGEKFNTKAFQKAYPALYSEFIEPTPGYRRLMLK